MNVARIREEFPALARRHHGRPVAYFDGPGGTQVPARVVDAMADYLLHHNANTHWAYATSQETDGALIAARQAFADFFNAAPREVVFGANMTSLTFHLSRALGRQMGPGDEVIVTELDHHANIAPWQALARERGVELRWVNMRPETGQLDMEDLERKLGERTRLVAMGAASNALGTVNDVARARALAHAAGAMVFVDAVHFAPHHLVDVQAMGCDWLACSAYEFYGPHVGVLWGRHPLLERLDVPKLDPAPGAPPERWETGTQNHEGIVGAAAAVDFLASLGEGSGRRERLRHAFSAIDEHGRVLVQQLWEGLESIPGVTLFGPGPEQPRTPTVSFIVRGVPAADVCTQLAAQGLFVSHGDFYATTAVERLGQSAHGLVRVGCACYTEPDEVDRLIDAVRVMTAPR